jgi:hypothetical protein
METEELKVIEELLKLHIKVYNKNIEINNTNNKSIMEIIDTNHRYTQQLEKELNELREQLTQRKERFQHNLMYIEVIEEIITNKETEWEGKQFTNMLVRIAGRPDEVYKIFVSVANAPSVGDSVNFIFNADDNKLSKLRIIKPNE